MMIYNKEENTLHCKQITTLSIIDYSQQKFTLNSILNISVFTVNSTY